MKYFLQACETICGLCFILAIPQICTLSSRLFKISTSDSITLIQTMIEASTCLVAILGAYIAWKEYQNTHRPILLLRIKKENHYRCGQFYYESISYVLANEGTMPAQNITVRIHPGIPWPMASHPAGDPQQELRERKVTYLSPKAEVTLLFTGRDEYEDMLSSTHCSNQNVVIEYSRLEHKKREKVEFPLDPMDIAYLESHIVVDPFLNENF